MIIYTIFSNTILANPQGGQIVSGNVVIQQTPNATTINQSSQKAIINWQSFNINQSESTQFQQPAGGATLNRINPTQGVSQIFGKLTATGQIILINPAGIYFGPSAYVNVGSLIATTANMTDQDFLNNNYYFTYAAPYSGSIINEGTIIAADHGLIALVGNNVQNDGYIQANLGRIVLASGSAFAMNFDGTNLISFTVDKSLNANSVRNTGIMRADGGQILVTAKAAANVLDNVINMEGVAQARSVGIQNGEIILYADSGRINVAAKIDASGKNVGEKGGKVKILAQQVALTNNTTIDVSGDSGGGEILIGGNTHGAGPERNAAYTYIGPNASINASALTQGNGGKVIVWSDLGTQFYGSIFARGGSQEGNGGFVEVSSGNNLAFLGKVDTHALFGKTGSLLLDPFNLYIINGTSGSGDLDASISSGIISFSVPDLLNNTLSVEALQLLGDTNITLQAKNMLTVGDSIGNAAQINLSATLITGTITFQAGDTSTIGGGNIIFNAGSSITTGGGNINLIAGDAITQKTDNATIGTLATSGGNISIIAQQAVTLNGTLDSSGGTISISGNTGLLSVNQNINSANNTISLTGAGITAAPNTIINAGTGTLSLNAGNNTITTNSGSKLLSTSILSLTANNLQLSALGNAQVGGDASGSTSDFAANTIITGTSGTSIGIAGAAGTLALPINVLATIHSTSVRIGDSNTGAITIGTWTPASTLANNGVITLDSAGSITQTGALNLSTSNASLLLRDSSSINLTDNNNVVRNFAATINGSLSFINAPTNLLTVTSLTDDISTVNGISAPSGVTLTTSGSGGLLRVNQNVTTINNAITLTGNGITQGGNTTIDAGSSTLTLNGNSGTITTGSSSKLLSTGTITIIGNKMLLSALGTAQVGGDGSATGTDFASNVILKEGTAGTTIGIAGGAGTLSLPANELATIHAINVQIGDGNAGAIRISTWTPNATFAKNGVLTLNSGGTITQTGAINLATSDASLLLRATGVTLTTSGNVFNNIAADISGALSITNTATNPLTVTSLTDTNSTVTGITAFGNVTLATSGTGGALTVNGDINTSSANGNIVLNSMGFSLAANRSLNAGSGNITINAGTGTLNLNAGSSLLSTTTVNLTADAMAFDTSGTPAQIGGTSIGTGHAATVIVKPSTTGTTLGIAGGIGSLQLSSNELNDVFANNVRIGNNITGNIAIGTWTSTSNFATNILTLDTAGTITQSGPINLSASNSNLLIRSGNDITLTNANNALSTIASETNGNLAVTNRADSTLIVTSLTDDIGTVNGLTTISNNNITLSNSGRGDIIFNSNAAGTSGNIFVNAGRNINLNSGNISTAGNIQLIANSGAISETGTGTISGALLTTHSTTGTTLNNANTISSFNAANSVSGDITLMNTATPLNIISMSEAGGGNATINNTGGITTNGAINGGTGTITLLSTADIILNNTITTNKVGDAIVLAGQTFTNNAGLNALNPGSGRFLVWSDNPVNDNRGGLAYNFKQYNATFGLSTILGSGNGFLYTITPLITPALTGIVAKVYDATTAATLANSNYAALGAIDGDTVNLNNPINGIYAAKNVGNNINVSTSGLAIDNVINGSATIYGYQLMSTTVNNNIGIITPALLTAHLTGAISKVFDSTTAVMLSTSNYIISGLLSSDTIALSNFASGHFDSPNIGSNKTVSVSGLTISGASANNYQLASTSINANIGAITPITSSENSNSNTSNGNSNNKTPIITTTSNSEPSVQVNSSVTAQSSSSLPGDVMNAGNNNHANNNTVTIESNNNPSITLSASLTRTESIAANNLLTSTASLISASKTSNQESSVASIINSTINNSAINANTISSVQSQAIGKFITVLADATNTSISNLASAILSSNVIKSTFNYHTDHVQIKAIPSSETSSGNGRAAEALAENRIIMRIRIRLTYLGIYTL